MLELRILVDNIDYDSIAEYLIPAVREVFIRGVDMETGTMRVRNMKGLATDED